MTAFVVFFAVAAPASGQQRRQRPEAITDPAQAGADFGMQGEYAGWLFFPGRGYEYAGLQVVALGDGKFDAALYRGGLPGSGCQLRSMPARRALAWVLPHSAPVMMTMSRSPRWISSAVWFTTLCTKLPPYGVSAVSARGQPTASATAFAGF